MNDVAFGFGLKLLALTFNLGFALVGALGTGATPFAALTFFSSPPAFLGPLNAGIGWMNMFDLGFALAGVAAAEADGADGVAGALCAGLLFGGWAPIVRAWALAASLAARSRMAFWRSSSLARIYHKLNHQFGGH